MVGVPPTPAESAARAVAAHVPALRTAALVALGSGLDHTAFRCGDLVLRVARDGGSVARERDLLALLGPRLPLPVPAPLFADEDLGVLAHPLLPGRSLLGRVLPPGAARRLGAFLTELHAVDAALVAPLVVEEGADPRAWLAELDGPPRLLAVLHADVPPPGARRALTHADLGAEHLLEAGGALTGVLDWSDAAVTDPALDFARLLRDFGPGFLRAVLDAYDLERPDEAAAARIGFFARCAALEDLAFARGGGPPEYGTTARASLARLFPGLPLDG